MSKDYGVEIEEIKKQLEELQQLVSSVMIGSSKEPNEKVGDIEKMQKMHPNEHVNAIMNEIQNAAGTNGQTGAITYMGVFASGGRQSNWVKHRVNTDDLLKLIADNVAEKVLACLGNADRLKILLALLKKPMSVAELVTECELNSTGQAYHHMKPLLAADLIAEETKGIYIVKPYRVQGIIMLLAGICDMYDETYAKSNWEAEE